MIRPFLLLLPAAVAFLTTTSCVTTETPPPPPSGPGHGHGHDHPHDDVVPIPPISWGLQPRGVGYDVDVRVGRDTYHVGEGGEYMQGRRVSRNSRDVPPGTVSAFEVLLPDGEVDLYWVEEGRPGSLVVYHKFYDAMDDRWSGERRLRTIRY